VVKGLSVRHERFQNLTNLAKSNGSVGNKFALLVKTGTKLDKSGYFNCRDSLLCQRDSKLNKFTFRVD